MVLVSCFHKRLWEISINKIIAYNLPWCKYVKVLLLNFQNLRSIKFMTCLFPGQWPLKWFWNPWYYLKCLAVCKQSLFPWCQWSCSLSCDLYLWDLSLRPHMHVRVCGPQSIYTVLVRCFYCLILMRKEAYPWYRLLTESTFLFSLRVKLFYLLHTHKSLSNILFLMLGNESTHAIHMKSTWFLHLCTRIIKYFRD